jgi:dTDP-4-dehydrorhamnose 3,5-epimerase
MPFKFSRMSIPDVVLIEPQVFSDPRGFFVELFKASEFQANGVPTAFVQVNHSLSKKNVLRGLHYQLNPKAQAKLISVVRGEIFDVTVDIRRGSPTYGQWTADRLSGANKKMLFIPEGFAHGFCVLSDEAEVIYYSSREYAPQLERNILWNDPRIGIVWPVKGPLLSSKDAGGAFLSGAENNFEFFKEA